MEELCASCAVETKICTVFFSEFQIRYCCAIAVVRRFSCTCECRDVGQRCPSPGFRGSPRHLDGGPRKKRSGGDESVSLRSPAATEGSRRLRPERSRCRPGGDFPGCVRRFAVGDGPGLPAVRRKLHPARSGRRGPDTRARGRRDGVLPCGRLASPGGSKGPSGALRPRIGRVSREFAPRPLPGSSGTVTGRGFAVCGGFGRSGPGKRRRRRLRRAFQAGAASWTCRRGFGTGSGFPGDAPRRGQTGLRGARLALGDAAEGQIRPLVNRYRSRVAAPEASGRSALPAERNRGNPGPDAS